MPTDPDDKITQSWATNARAWTEAVRNGSIESRERVTNRAIIDAVMAHSSERLLDLGCGEGWLVRALTEQGVQATGVDGSPGLIEAARASGGGEFLLFGYQDLIVDPARAGDPYDVIAANFALLQEDLSPLLKALATCLVPGGLVIIQTVHPGAVERPDEEGWREEDFQSFEGNWRAMPWYYRSREGWQRLLEESGYQVESVQEPTHPHNGRPMSLLLIARPLS